MGFFDKLINSTIWGFGWHLGGRAANDVYDKAKEVVSDTFDSEKPKGDEQPTGTVMVTNVGTGDKSENK